METTNAGNQKTGGRPKPVFLPSFATFAAVILALADQRVFCPWRYATNSDGGKPNKEPIDIHRPGCHASFKDQSTLCTLAEARAWVERGDADGINILTGPITGIAAIDVDGLSNEGIPKPIKNLIKQVGQIYMESSPSGLGLRCFTRAPATLKPQTKRTKNVEGCKEIEFFYQSFASVTGIACGAPDITSVNGELQPWLDETFAEKPLQARKQRNKSTGTDDEILALVKDDPRVTKLMVGDKSDYDEDSSGAVSGLAFLLAPYTHDEDQLERLLRLSKLDPGKWNDARPGGTWLRAEVIADAIAKVPLRDPRQSLYERRGDGMYEIVKGIAYRLSNFWATLLAVEIKDRGEGAEPDIRYLLRCGVGTDAMEVSVTSKELEGTTWPEKLTEKFATAHIEPGCRGNVMRAAILQTSQEDQIERRRVLTHTGQHKLGGDSVFAVPNGVMRVDRFDRTVRVELDQELNGYALTDPSEGEELVTDVKSLLRVLRIRKAHVMFPLVTGVMGVIVSPPRASIHVHGRPGCGKTETSLIPLRFCAPGYHRERLPATWEADTENALTSKMEQVRDLPLLIDDFLLEGSEREVAPLVRKMKKIFGAQGNGHTPSRCQPNGRLIPTLPCTGVVLSTGETALVSESRVSRGLFVEADKTDWDVESFQAAQEDSRAGKHNRAFSAWVQWCLARREELRKFVSDTMEEFAREESKGKGRSGRYGLNTGWFVAAFKLMTRWAREVGALDDREKSDLDSEALAVFVALIDEQAKTVATAKPDQMFLDNLRAALAAQHARIDNPADKFGLPKEYKGALGWRFVNLPSGGQWIGANNPIGWVIDDEVFLQPAKAREAAMEYAPNKGTGIPDVNGLSAALKAAGVLTKVEKGGQNSVKKTIPGVGSQRVWQMKLSSIVEPPNASVLPEE